MKIRGILLAISILLIGVGIYLDLNAISRSGNMFFFLGLFISLILILIDHKEYVFFFRPKKHFTDFASSVEILIKKFPKIFTIFTVLIALLIIVSNIIFRSTDAYGKLISELPNDSEYSIGFIISGSISTKSDSESDERACFYFSLYSSKNSRVNACLYKKEGEWVIDDTGILYE